MAKWEITNEDETILTSSTSTTITYNFPENEDSEDKYYLVKVTGDTGCKAEQYIIIDPKVCYSEPMNLKIIVTIGEPDVVGGGAFNWNCNLGLEINAPYFDDCELNGTDTIFEKILDDDGKCLYKGGKPNGRTAYTFYTTTDCPSTGYNFTKEDFEINVSIHLCDPPYPTNMIVGRFRTVNYSNGVLSFTIYPKSL